MASAQQPATAPAADQTPAPTATPAATTPVAAQATPGAAQATPAGGTPPAAAATPGTVQAGTAPPANGKGAKKVHAPKPKKEKPPKMVPVTIERGVLTVDGWTGKADLNYSIQDLKFIYLWAPGIGTAVISSEPFGKAQLQAGAFNGHTLTVNVSGHTLQLASDRDLLSGKEIIKPAYVLLDTDYIPANSSYPQFGYGVTPAAPYAWPASLANYTGDVARAPALPKNMLPTLKTNCTPAAPAAKTDAAKTDVAKADAPKTPCSGAPTVMYPVKETKQEKAAVKKDEKKGEKVDESFK